MRRGSRAARDAGGQRKSDMRDATGAERIDGALRAIVEATAGAIGAEFYPALVRSIAQSLDESLQVRAAFIAEVLPEGDRVRTIALWEEGALRERVTYALAGTPCEETLAGRGGHSIADVLARFPKAGYLGARAESLYVGQALIDAAGKPLGLIVLVCGRSSEADLALALLALLAPRVAGEIVRTRAEAALRTEKERLEHAMAGSQLALWDIDLVTGRIYVSAYWKRMLGEPGIPRDSEVPDLWALVHPQDVEMVKREFTLTIKGRVPEYFVVHRVRKTDGSWLWIQSHGKVVERSANGRALRLVGTNVDVTERELAKQGLAQRERELRSMTDNMPMMVALFDRQMRYRYANRRYCAFFGVEAESIIGRPAVETIGDEAHREIQPYVQRVLDGDMALYERVVRPKQPGQWIEVLLFPDVDENWEVRGCYSLSVDITKRKESEGLVRESEARFRSLVELSSDWYWEQDQRYRFTRIEGIAFAKYGIDTNTLIGKTRWEIGYGNVSPAQWMRHREQLERRETFVDFLGVRYDSSGEIEFASMVSGRPIFDQTGKFLGYRGIGRDVTQQVRAERALAHARAKAEAAEERLRTAIESLDDAFALYDAEDRLVMCNERYKHYYPLSRDKMVPGARFEDILRAGVERGEYSGTAGRVEEWIAERLEQHRRANSTIEQQHGDGRWLKISERRTPEGGTVGVRVDITELKDVQARAEAASRAKGEFLATMSHEIRTPINGVLGIAELLLESELNAEQRHHVHTIYQSGRTLLQILNDVLDHAKIEAGKLDLESASFDLARIADEAAALLATRAAEKGLELIVHYDTEAPRYLVGDAGRIHQVLANLIGNAIKFTERGHVLLRVEGHALEDKQARVLISVRDTGIGISEDSAKRLFQPFTQAESSTTRRFGGTGLGLVICRRLVEMMGGEIGMQSVRGEGSVFSVVLTLPVGEPPEAPAESLLSGVPALVVDDHPVSREALAARMAGFGMQVQLAKDGEEALAAITAARANGVPHRAAILAHRSQGIDAEALAQRIRSGASGSPALVLLLPFGSKRRGANPGTHGVDITIGQPVGADQLHETLAVAIGLRAPGSGSARKPASAAMPKLQGRVLLAEDNAVNRQVAVTFLQRAGAVVDIVENGREAVEATEREHFDLILMDLHMPEMDGIEATRLIRARESETGLRTPIVAMTANVMPEAKRAFLEAGIDDFVSKPFVGKDFVATLARWLRAADAREPQVEFQSGCESARPVAAVDRLQLDALRDAVGKDLIPIVQAFLRTVPGMLVNMSDACERGDAIELRRIAHSLRASSGTLGARTLSDLARDLEAQASEHHLKIIAERLSVMSAEFERVRAELATMGSSGAA